MSEIAFHRRFVHIGGYYPMSPADSHRRFQRELGRFCATWGLAGRTGPVREEAHAAHWTVDVEGAGWQGHVDHILVRWDDVINQDRSRSWLTRLGLAAVTFVDFVFSGAFFRYIAVSWRYALFFLYPFTLLALICSASFLGAWGLTKLAHISPTLPVALPLGAAIYGVALHQLGDKLMLDHLLDDWIYAMRVVRGGDAEVEARLDRLAAELTADERTELLIVGHSFGAVFGAELIARMLALRPDGPPVRFASVGSSILKIGLHRAARKLRATLTRLGASPRVIWCDFYALNDVMNFYPSEPMSTLRLPGAPARGINVRFRRTVHPDFYAKMERNFFRMHSQFISANDRRAPYDYFMLMCGPFALETLAASPEGAIPFIDENGALTAEGRTAMRRRAG